MDRRQFLQASAGSLVLSSCLPKIVSAFADEPKSAALIQTLPKDGTWSEFQVIAKVGGREIALTWAVRSVGQAVHGGKQCRFIEMERSDPQGEVKNGVWRLLVPEEEFGEGKDPLSKAVKHWLKNGTDDAEAAESVLLKDPFLAVVLSGPKQNLKAEEAKEKINWQQGDLECSVTSGRTELDVAVVKFSGMYRVFRHKDVPFGFAGMHLDMTYNAGGQMETSNIKMTLRDHGKDAKAKLPELLP